MLPNKQTPPKRLTVDDIHSFNMHPHVVLTDIFKSNKTFLYKVNDTDELKEKEGPSTQMVQKEPTQVTSVGSSSCEWNFRANCNKDEVLKVDAASLPDSCISDASLSKLNDQLILDPPVEKVVIEAQDQLVSSATSPVPLKKRAVFQVDDVETVKPKKRMVINRNNVPTPILKPAVEALAIKPSDKADNEKGKAVPIEYDETKESGSGKKVVHITALMKMDLSDAEKIQMRAKRFNITTPLTTEAIKVKNTLEPSKKKNITQWKTKVPTLCPFTSPPNIDVLKKRAERFGGNVSSVLKKLEEEEEKLEQRKAKFGQALGDMNVTSSEDEEKKKKRAERFGL